MVVRPITNKNRYLIVAKYLQWSVTQKDKRTLKDNKQQQHHFGCTIDN